MAGAIESIVKLKIDISELNQGVSQILSNIEIVLHVVSKEVKGLEENTKSLSGVLGKTLAVSGEVAKDVLGGLAHAAIKGTNALVMASVAAADYAKESETMASVMSDGQIEKLNVFSDTMQQLTAETTMAKSALGLMLLPVLQDLGTTGSELIHSFSHALIEADGDMSKMDGALADLAQGIVETMATTVPQLLRFAQSVVTAVVQGITTILPQLADIAGDIITQLFDGLLPLLPMVFDAGLKLLMTLLLGIAQNLPDIIPATVAVIMQLIATLIDNLPLILETGLQLLIGLLTGILNGRAELIAQLPTIIDAIVEFFAEAIPILIEAGVQLLMALIEALPRIAFAIVQAMPQIIQALVTFFTGPALPYLIGAGGQLLLALIANLPQVISTITESLPQIITAIVQFIVASAPQLIQAGVELLSSLVSNIHTIISNIISTIGQIPGRIVATVQSWVGQMSAAGGNLIGGLVQGLVNGAGAIINKIKDICAGAINAVKSFFGIGSPSKVFKRLGEFTGEGFAIGLGEQLDDINAMLKKRLRFDLGTVKALINTDVNGLGSRTVATGAWGMQQTTLSNGGNQTNNYWSIGDITYIPDSRMEKLIGMFFAELMREYRMGAFT
jgi:phage-related protein